jgi:hypothetical protein
VLAVVLGKILKHWFRPAGSASKFLNHLSKFPFALELPKDRLILIDVEGERVCPQRHGDHIEGLVDAPLALRLYENLLDRRFRADDVFGHGRYATYVVRLKGRFIPLLVPFFAALAVV